jgi:transmembrane sensor
MNSSHSSRDLVADEQAALWAARLEGGALTATDREALDVWLSKAPTHRALLSHYCQFSADLEQQLPALVAAGAITMPATSPRVPVRRGWRASWFAGVTLAAAALVVFGFWVLRAPAPQFENISTAVAQRQVFTLSDGTQVELNARTSLRIAMTASERRVKLADGEAFFTVSKDASRPFFVETPTGSVRVTGTVFNIRTETAAALDVVVVEGSVQVEPAIIGGTRASGPVSLVAGDRLTASAQGVSTRAVSANERDDVLAWRQGQIVFNDVPLAVALARFSHYHGRNLSTSPASAGLSIGGRYSLDDLQGFLTELESAMKTTPVRVTREANGDARVSLRSER